MGERCTTRIWSVHWRELEGGVEVEVQMARGIIIGDMKQTSFYTSSTKHLMESPNKRPKVSPESQPDFVALDDDDGGSRFGYGEEDSFHAEDAGQNAHGGRGRRRYLNDARFERRNAQDRPKSQHVLPGHEPWVVVKTKLGRRFVHNTQTKESLWHAPDDIWPAVKEFDGWERERTEKQANVEWAEEQLKKMRAASQAEKVGEKAEAEGRDRRRRSESLQREDEEAMMAELAAEAGRAGEQDVKAVVTTLEPVAGDVGYDSGGSYEYVEVTDEEGEEGDEGREDADPEGTRGDDEAQHHPEDGPVEFGEDDIAWQLQAMGEDYGLDRGEYDVGDDDEGEAGAEGLPISEEDAANLFRDLLQDYHISPFTPWDTLIADESEASILNDDRYTVLPNMRARKEVWDQWTKDKAAQIKEERAKMARRDPKIPYLAFLAEKATPKLYWLEFKRKFKKEPELNDRKLPDKDREKLYRDHINRLKLPETTRKADLLTLLKSLPLRHLNRTSTLDSLPQQLLSHLHFISLPRSIRDPIIRQHIVGLPDALEGDDAELSAEELAMQEKKRSERRRREVALEARQREVEAQKRRTDQERSFAGREWAEGESEVRTAMRGGGGGGGGGVSRR